MSIDASAISGMTMARLNVVTDSRWRRTMRIAGEGGVRGCGKMGVGAAGAWAMRVCGGASGSAMIPLRPRSRAQTIGLQKGRVARKLVWPTYFGTTTLLLLIVVALAGGII